MSESEWKSVKHTLPPFGQYVEVIFGPKSILNSLRRGYAALWQDDEDGIYWVRDSMTEIEFGDKFGITHWTWMKADHLGRRPVLYVDKRNYFQTKLVRRET